MPPRPFTATDVVGLQSTAAAQPADPPPVPDRTEPVTLPRRSPEATRAYHEGYAAALEAVAGWLRDKADKADTTAAMHRTFADWQTAPAPDPTADRAQLAALGARS